MADIQDQINNKLTPDEQKHHKQKLIRRVIYLCLALIPLFIWYQTHLLQNNDSSFTGSNVLIFALINLNVLLVLVVLFLVLRNLAELLFEKRVNKIGRTLKTKLIASFLSLTLIPAVLLFFVALQFVSTSMDYWFNSNIENSLEESLKLAQSVLKDKENRAGIIGKAIAFNIHGSNHNDVEIKELFDKVVNMEKEDGPDAISLISTSGKQTISATKILTNEDLPRVPVTLLEKAKRQNSYESIIQETPLGDLVRSIAPIKIAANATDNKILVTSILIPTDELARMTAISRGVEGYRQLKYFKEPFKFWLLIILLIVTLLIVFAAIWFGIYIARGITGPIENLVEATNRVAEGDLEFTLNTKSNDEMGLLIDSFNQMTSNLYHSNDQLEKTYQALMISSQESEQRRLYTEIILQNVSAGVISLDKDGAITTINHFAEKLLKINRDYFIGLTFPQVLPQNQSMIIAEFITELQETEKTSLQQHIKLQVAGKSYSLLINFSRLEDDKGKLLGFVLVFDNLTKIEKMQRMAAWREVARRIAHEIKNPLTPIQLSAQRLRRRYPDILEEENSVFDKCTATIISQVDVLKNLVSEFSQFARMPKVQKTVGSIQELTEKTLVLYKEGHKDIDFSWNADNIPKFRFDSEQLGRCLVNLLDNGIAALEKGDSININLSISEDKESVFIAVADTGPGISKENKLKLFEPYFSTKKTGTGLGLAIVSTIIADHNGYIRVQDNKPKGSIFTIELPLNSSELIIK